MTTLRKALEAELIQRQWTQKDLAERLGVSPQAVSQWTSLPQPHLRLDNVRRLRDVFNWGDDTVAKIFGRDVVAKIRPRGPRPITGVGLVQPAGSARAGRRRVAVIGAGTAGSFIVGRLLADSESERQPVAIIDDNDVFRGTRVHEIEVLGGIELLRGLVAEREIDEVLVACPSRPDAVRKTADQLRGTLVRLTVLPSRDARRASPSTVTVIRDVTVQDLLASTDPVVDDELAAQTIAGQKVLITGAGGWLGREAARQILSFGPASLTLLDRDPTSLDLVVSSLSSALASTDGVVRTEVADASDHSQIKFLIEKTTPSIVFHMAGHKPGPSLERSPCSAVRNNFLAFVHLVHAARDSGTSVVVAPSTPKAARPASVAAQVAWLRERFLAETQPIGRYHLVRHGELTDNPDGVVARLQKQMDDGENLIVPGYKAKRRFLTMRQAVQLMVHVAAGPERSAVVAAEFGVPYSLRSLSQDLIWLSPGIGQVPSIHSRALTPDEDSDETPVGERETSLSPDTAGIVDLPVTSDAPLVTPRRILELEELVEEQSGEAICTMLNKLTSAHTHERHADPTSSDQR